MYKIVNDHWVHDFNDSCITDKINNDNVYKLTDTTLSIMHSKIYGRFYGNFNGEDACKYNHEDILVYYFKQVEYKNAKNPAMVLCQLCGNIKFCKYSTNDGYSCCVDCTNRPLSTTFITNTRPKNTISEYFLEQGIDYAYLSNNKVIYLCRTTLRMTNFDVINNIYLNNVLWFKIHSNKICNYCFRLFVACNNACKQCYNFAKTLFYKESLYYWLLQQCIDILDVKYYILYYLLTITGFHVTFKQICEYYNKNKGEIKEEIKEDTKEENKEEEEEEEDYTYIIENYEDIYGLNDVEQQDDELGYWSED
jgi:hypothetical protein